MFPQSLRGASMRPFANAQPSLIALCGDQKQQSSPALNSYDASIAIFLKTIVTDTQSMLYYIWLQNSFYSRIIIATLYKPRR